VAEEHGIAGRGIAPLHRLGNCRVKKEIQVLEGPLHETAQGWGGGFKENGASSLGVLEKEYHHKGEGQTLRGKRIKHGM